MYVVCMHYISRDDPEEVSRIMRIKDILKLFTMYTSYYNDEGIQSESELVLDDRIPSSMKFLRDFCFADWRFF